MENPVQNKRFPWGWVAAGCGILAILAAAAVAAVVLVVLPAVRNTTTSQNPISNLLPTPLAGATAAPTTGTSNGTTSGSLPFKFSAVQDPTTLPNQSLMDQMVTTLNLNNETDFMAPKSYKGTTALDPSTSFTVGNGWCAKDSATLKQNLANMQFQLSINGTNIDLSQYPTLYFSDNQGESCAQTGIVITPSGTVSGTYHVVLTQKFLSSLNDGITGSPYPAGNVVLDFNIQFRVIPSSGSNT